MDLHHEVLIVIRAALLHQLVGQALLRVLLDNLLQHGLVILKGRLLLFLDEMPCKGQHKAPGRLDSPIQVDGGYHRLKGVR